MAGNALESTDVRIAAGKPVTAGFLFAALLWEPVLQDSEACTARGMSDIQAYEAAGSDVIERQIQHVSLPRRFSLIVREIWDLQPRLVNRRGRGTGEPAALSPKVQSRLRLPRAAGRSRARTSGSTRAGGHRSRKQETTNGSPCSRRSADRNAAVDAAAGAGRRARNRPGSRQSEVAEPCGRGRPDLIDPSDRSPSALRKLVPRRAVRVNRRGTGSGEIMVERKFSYIVVEGPIGVGKTTLAKRLAASFGGHALLEAPEKNPFLPRFYESPQTTALATQLFFLPPARAPARGYPSDRHVRAGARRRFHDREGTGCLRSSRWTPTSWRCTARSTSRSPARRCRPTS